MIACVFSFVLMLGFAQATDQSANKNSAKKSDTPRFVSLRSKEVNGHVGPGNTYPVLWCFIRKNMPVEVLAEFDTWRKIRDLEGAEVWVHQSLLSGKRHVMVTQKQQSLRAAPESKSAVRAKLDPGVVAHLKECQGQWCKVEVQNNKGRYQGWMKRSALWGVYSNETKI